MYVCMYKPFHFLKLLLLLFTAKDALYFVTITTAIIYSCMLLASWEVPLGKTVPEVSTVLNTKGTVFPKRTDQGQQIILIKAFQFKFCARVSFKHKKRYCL